MTHDAAAIVKELLAEPARAPRAAELSDELAAAVVDQLKQEADRHWLINANRSLEVAELIVQIGETRGDPRHIALGLMARGDALRQLGQLETAWSCFERAGCSFLEVGDEVGWGRTRVGRLALCTNLNRVAEALADAERARAIFLAAEERERLMKLELNTGYVYHLLGEQRRALEHYQLALGLAQALGPAGDLELGRLHTNIGNVYYALGELQRALEQHQEARRLMYERGETSGGAIADLNIAQIAVAQGHYRWALQLLYQARDLCLVERLTLDATNISRYIVECYVLLNRYEEARELARELVETYGAHGDAYQQALTLLLLATAEAELSNFPAAKAALDTAEPIFASLQGASLVATIRLRRGQIALRQGDVEQARQEALAAAGAFGAEGQQAEYAAAMLLYGQTLQRRDELEPARAAALEARRIAGRCNLPPLRYSALLLLGQIAEARGNLVAARRRYAAAAATVERVQQGLTITLRPGFLEDKGEALRALLALQLRAGHAAQAFETLERAKSQLLLSYLTNREQLRWSHEDPQTRELIDELDLLRARHQWLYRQAQQQPGAEELVSVALTPELARQQLRDCERRMRAITEQLYLRAGAAEQHPLDRPSLELLQRTLDEQTVLLAFYNDGQALWAFSLDARSLELHRLPLEHAGLERLLQQLQRNLSLASAGGRSTPGLASLTQLAHQLLQQLHRGLLAPLEGRLQARRRLVIVPYGSLHYLPFHLLRTGRGYLFEEHELVTLPAASLMLPQIPGSREVRSGASGAPAAPQTTAQDQGARVLAYTWEGRLSQVEAEARAVHQLWGGELHSGDQAVRTALRGAPRQILHIAAHGQYRLDHPELSYVQLADGQLYADDLLQHDLSYELVTLSACETGRAAVAAGDELIGLGRALLYAGAHTLLLSMWRVDDELACRLMGHFYQGLAGGGSKAAALQRAQRALLQEAPGLHPALWGAFQLIGSADPLSSVPSSEFLVPGST